MDRRRRRGKACGRARRLWIDRPDRASRLRRLARAIHRRSEGVPPAACGWPPPSPRPSSGTASRAIPENTRAERAHTILVIVWHLLANDQTYTDLGADYYTHREDPETRKNRPRRQLHDLGYQADLTALAA